MLDSHSLTAVLALAGVLPQDDPLALLRVVDCARANEAVAIYDKSVSAELAEFDAVFQPLDVAWAAADEAFDAQRSTARVELEQALRKSVANTGRGSQVEEALRLEEALLVLESDESPPLLPSFGRPARGSKKWHGHFYSVIDESLDWHAARARCTELGGVLACAETEEELDHLRKLVHGWTWIGASDATEEARWKWLNGEAVDVAWSDRQPDNANGREHAAALNRDGELHDRHAFENSAFLCEWGATHAYPWNFKGRAAARALERHDRAVRAARDEHEETRARILESMVKPRTACESGLERALGKLVEALDKAIRREVRQGRARAALEMREARDALAAGASHPTLPGLGASATPEDALAFAGRHYKLYDEAMPWHAAEQRCRELGGRLALLADADVRAVFADDVGSKGAWVGALRIDREYLWTDGTAVEEGWGEGEPNNFGGGENATLLKPTGLNDGDSEVRIAWICEW